MNATQTKMKPDSEPNRTERATRTNPFVEKRARRRQITQARAMSHVRVPIHADFKLQHRQRRLPPWVRAGIGILVLVVSVGLHVGFVIMALGVGKWGAHRSQERERLSIEMREREVKPKEPEKQPEPPKPEPPKPERVVVAKAAPPVAKIPEPPKEPEKKAPPRIVGLSFESTVGEGNGDGPSFAVGNTRLGETEKVAAKKEDVPKERPAPLHGTEKPTVANQVATRIPSKGVTFTEAKYRKQVKPDFPSTLKAQGIESDVDVLVFIDATGKVTNVKILRESPYPEFNEAAKKAALATEWEPATRNGEPMPSTKKYSYRFRLTDD
jgi:TonB family protein